MLHETMSGDRELQLTAPTMQAAVDIDAEANTHLRARLPRRRQKLNVAQAEVSRLHASTRAAWIFAPEINADELATPSLIDDAQLTISRFQETDVLAIKGAVDVAF